MTYSESQALLIKCTRIIPLKYNRNYQYLESNASEFSYSVHVKEFFSGKKLSTKQITKESNQGLDAYILDLSVFYRLPPFNKRSRFHEA